MKFYFDEFEIWEKEKRRVFDELNASHLPVVLIGRQITINPEFLERIKCPVEYVCSNTPSVWGTTWWGKRVISPTELPKIYSKYNALILISNHSEVLTAQLNALPIPPQKIFTLDMYFDNSDTSTYFASVQKDLELVYSHLADQQSRDTYEAMVHYRINHDPEIVKPVALPMKGQYFPVMLGDSSFLHDHEVFVDAGAYTGDTVQDFFHFTKGQYDHVYAFEPDPTNYSKLVNSTRKMQDISCFQLGIGETPSEMHFNALESMGSRVDETGSCTVQIDCLDNVLANVPVTYIKMDIEGMECPALRGAKRLIQTNKPKLAICIYHSDRDMVEVPKLILNINPEYKLYIRQYARSAADIVCYAV